MTFDSNRIYDLEKRYGEPHRYYHTWNHVEQMKHRFMCLPGYTDMSDIEKTIINLAIEYHDAIYDPRKTDNEFQSMKLFIDHNKYYVSGIVNDQNVEHINDLIMSTMPDTYVGNYSGDPLVKILRYLDAYPFYTNNVTELIQNFKLILKEYQFVSYPEFKNAHLEFFNKFSKITNCNELTRQDYVEFVNNYRPRIGIYAGSFNPFHIGHLSVLEQSEKLFDKVIVAKPPLIPGAIWGTPDSKEVNHTKEVLPFHEVIIFDGLLVDYIKEVQEYADVTLIRGLRNGDDLTYEINMKSVNEDIAGHIYDTVYFVTDKPHVSSTVVRSLIGTDAYNLYIPKKYDYSGMVKI